MGLAESGAFILNRALAHSKQGSGGSFGAAIDAHEGILQAPNSEYGTSAARASTAPQFFEEGGYVTVALFHFFSPCVRAADSQTSLPGMVCLFGNTVEHQRTTGDGFDMMMRVGETDK